jgi:hypothetical protein
MSFHKHDLLNHFKDLLPALEQAGVEAALNARTFHLTLRKDGKSCVLQPQFLVLQGGRQYTPKFGQNAARFIGWCPYHNKRWDMAREKLRFKAYAAANALLTPEHSDDPHAALQDVIVKRNVSSFSADIKGPFRRSGDCALQASFGEFYERFVAGRSAKIFYWENRPICLELEKPPTVRGDGASSIRALVTERAALLQKDLHAERCEGYLRYLGLSLEHVLPRGVEQAVDFRYGSTLNLPSDMDNFDLGRRMVPELAPQLVAIGDRLWAGIPEEVRENTLYTVDGVLDADNRLWLTEMNSNPFIHSFMYPTMVQALLGSGNAFQAAAPQVSAQDAASIGELLQLAMMQLYSGSLRQAHALWNRVLEMHPAHPAALFYSAYVLSRGTRVGDARQALHTLLRTAPLDNLYVEPARLLLAAIDGNGASGDLAGMPVPVGVLPGVTYPVAH